MADNRKVLLAEDEEQVRTLIARLLEKRGYEVLAAENGQQALSLAHGQLDEIVLLITDMIMPEMGGVALARELRKTRPELPVLCMTGYTREEVQSGVELADTPCIEKPFTPAALLERVDELAVHPDH